MFQIKENLGEQQLNAVCGPGWKARPSVPFNCQKGHLRNWQKSTKVSRFT